MLNESAIRCPGLACLWRKNVIDPKRTGLRQAGARCPMRGPDKTAIDFPGQTPGARVDRLIFLNGYPVGGSLRIAAAAPDVIQALPRVFSAACASIGPSAMGCSSANTWGDRSRDCPHK